MKKIAVIIPVSKFEKVDTILKSAKTVRLLDYKNLIVKIVYVVDEANDERIELLTKGGVEVLSRKSRGKRAGAINDALAYLKDFNPEYVAIFDVDSKPEKNFIKECINALESDSMAYIASSRRYVSNPINTVSKTVEAEYYILNFLIKKSGFKQFNGLIGVLRAKYLYMHKLNEDAITEDADYATRMHAKGYRAVLVDGTKIYEQSPVSWMDLLNQRKRWYYGGLQLWKYWDTVKKSNDRRFILSWVLALTLSYSALIFLPLVIFSPFLMIYYSRRATSKIHPSVSLMLIVHILLLQYSALAAVLKFLRRKSIEWKPMERVIE